MPSSAEIAEVKRALLAYWRRCPLAADDVDGIRRYWLSAADGSWSAGAVEAALQELVRDGYAARARLPGGRVVFSRRR